MATAAKVSSGIVMAKAELVADDAVCVTGREEPVRYRPDALSRLMSVSNTPPE